jgi:hypothetical protein
MITKNKTEIYLIILLFILLFGSMSLNIYQIISDPTEIEKRVELSGIYISGYEGNHQALYEALTNPLPPDSSRIYLDTDEVYIPVGWEVTFYRKSDGGIDIGCKYKGNK